MAGDGQERRLWRRLVGWGRQGRALEDRDYVKGRQALARLVDEPGASATPVHVRLLEGGATAP